MTFNPNPDLNEIITTVKRIRDRAYKLDNEAGIIQALNGYLDLLDGLQTYTDLDQLVWDQEKFWQADEAETARGRYEWQ